MDILAALRARSDARSCPFELRPPIRLNFCPRRAGANGVALQVLFNKGTGRLLGVHIIGIHAADLIQECSNAVAAGTTVEELSMMVHTHPTLCEVLDEAFKGGMGRSAH